MADLVTPPSPHHSFWASFAVTALTLLRPLFKLSDEESQAWDLVVGLLGSL